MKKRYVVAIVIVILLVTLAVFGITRGKVFDKSSDTKNNHTTNEHELLPEVDAYYGSEKIASISSFFSYVTNIGHVPCLIRYPYIVELSSLSQFISRQTSFLEYFPYNTKLFSS